MCVYVCHVRLNENAKGHLGDMLKSALAAHIGAVLQAQVSPAILVLKCVNKCRKMAVNPSMLGGQGDKNLSAAKSST